MPAEAEAEESMKLGEWRIFSLFSLRSRILVISGCYTFPLGYKKLYLPLYNGWYLLKCQERNAQENKVCFAWNNTIYLLNLTGAALRILREKYALLAGPVEVGYSYLLSD